MRLFGIVFLLAIISLISADDKYTTKYDNIDLDEILNSDRLLQNYANCVLNRGPCTPDGAELKRVLIDAMETECSKCSDKQKVGSHKVMEYLIHKKPKLWAELEAYYDPDGKYKQKYCGMAKERGLDTKDLCVKYE